VSTAMSTRIAAGVTATYLIDLSRGAAPASASASAAASAGRVAPGRAHAIRAHGAGLGRQASRRARLGATRGGSSGCLG
jgi:hypothetical protein